MVPFHFGPVHAFQPPTASPIRLPRTSLSHPKTCQHSSQASAAAFWGKPAEHRSRQRCSPRSSSSVTSVPPATLPLLFANPLYPPKKPHPEQRSGKRTPNAIPSGCRSQSCKSARASIALQHRQPPPRSRSSAAVSLHLVSFHFGAAPAFLPCFCQRNRFPRPGLSHPIEKLSLPTVRCHVKRLSMRQFSCKNSLVFFT